MNDFNFLWIWNGESEWMVRKLPVYWIGKVKTLISQIFSLNTKKSKVIIISCSNKWNSFTQKRHCNENKS